MVATVAMFVKQQAEENFLKQKSRNFGEFKIL